MYCKLRLAVPHIFAAIKNRFKIAHARLAAQLLQSNEGLQTILRHYTLLYIETRLQ